MINVYRNLNKAKRDPRRFVWSVATPPVKKSGGFGAGKGKLSRHTEAVVVLNPVGVCTGSLRTIADKGERQVAAWVRGVEAPSRPAGIERLITLNPLPERRGGRCELEFRFCRFEEGALVIEEPVTWSAVAAVAFTPGGAVAILA